MIDRLDKNGDFKTILGTDEGEELNGGYYAAEDIDPEHGKNVYRVRIALEDDYYMTSNLAYVTFPKAETDFLIVPNPAQDKVALIFAEYLISSKNNFLYVYDLNGKQHFFSEINQEELANPYFLNLSGFREGIYFISLNQEGQAPLTKKMVIAKP